MTTTPFRPTRAVTRLVLAALLLVAVGCGSSDDGVSASASKHSTVAETAGTSAATDHPSAVPVTEVGDPASTDPPAEAPAESSATDAADPSDGVVAPLPPLPDPAPAMACDGASVRCVDAASSGEGADGTAAAPFPTVTAALDGASAGSTIQVAAGTYDEPVVITEADGLSLVGGFPSGGDFAARDAASNETTLRGDESRSVVSVLSSHGIRVEGFHLTGGGGTTDTYRWYGGGVHVDQDSTDVTIIGNRIDLNAVDQGDDPGSSVGGGIASYGNDIRIVGNVIEHNRAGRGSGVASTGTTTIQGNTVNNNLSIGDHGGGLYVYGDVDVLGNHVEGNRVGEVLGYGWGGGLIAYGDETSATLQGNVMTGNYAVAAGSAVFIDDGADATLTDELYYANECTIDGGSGVLVDSGGVTPTVADLVNVTIAQHDCPNSGNGGALIVEISEADDPPCEVTVTGSIFWGNRADDVVSLGCNLTVTSSDLEQVVEGEGNISVDPMFIDPASGNFSLDPASPAAGLGATERQQ